MNKYQLRLQRELAVNTWLDCYNDYKILYEWFGDIKYKNAMDYCIRKIMSLPKG